MIRLTVHSALVKHPINGEMAVSTLAFERSK